MMSGMNTNGGLRPTLHCPAHAGASVKTSTVVEDDSTRADRRHGAGAHAQSAELSGGIPSDDNGKLSVSSMTEALHTVAGRSGVGAVRRWRPGESRSRVQQIKKNQLPTRVISR